MNAGLATVLYVGEGNAYHFNEPPATRSLDPDGVGWVAPGFLCKNGDAVLERIKTAPEENFIGALHGSVDWHFAPPL
jgi:hypothetical protein